MSCALTVKEGPRLKSKCKKSVQAAIEYMKMIDDFDDLVDPRTLAHHFLGLKPSSFILRAIEIEEKSDFFFFTPSLLFFFFLFGIEMMTKFNQEMYAKMKAKKNKSLSSLGKKWFGSLRRGSWSPQLSLSLKP